MIVASRTANDSAGIPPAKSSRLVVCRSLRQLTIAKATKKKAYEAVANASDTTDAARNPDRMYLVTSA